MLHVLLPLVHHVGATLCVFPDRDWNSLVLMLMEGPYTRTFKQARPPIDILLSRAWKRADDRHYPCKET